MKVDKKKLICSMLDSNMNNKQLADASGVSVTRVSNIRNGNNTTYETISKLANVLNVSVDTLIDTSNE